MANQYDCEPFLRALEEQADSIGAATTNMLQCLNTFKNSVESVIRSVENLKKMIAMIRRAMVLAHGDRVVERVEIKRESVTPPSQAAEKENPVAFSLCSQKNGMQNWPKNRLLPCRPTER